MGFFNDRKPVTHETWLDDSGIVAHIAIVQDPGNPLCIYYNGALVDLSAHRQLQGKIADIMAEFGSKFDILNGLDFNDQQKEIADRFAKLVFDQPGWYRGTIDYMLDENGKVVRIDGLKVTMTGAELPSDFFKRS